MESVSVREARERLRALVDAAARGETVTITRRGRPVARLGPAAPAGGLRLPTLTEFRASLRIRGKSMSATVIALRQRERA